MAPIKDQTLNALKQFRETQEKEYNTFLDKLVKLEQEEHRLVDELAVVREKMIQLHNSFASVRDAQAPQKCLSQANRNSTATRVPRSKYLLGRVPDADMALLSDDDLTKHIGKVAVSLHGVKREGDSDMITIVTDNLTRLRQEKNKRKLQLQAK